MIQRDDLKIRKKAAKEAAWNLQGDEVLSSLVQ